MRVATIAAVFVLAGCATFGGGGGETVEFTVPVPPDTALRISRTQLQTHGYEIGLNERNTVVTQPRAVPQEAGSDAVAQPARRWIVRVEAAAMPFSGDTKVRVTGYLLPESGASTPGDTSRTTSVTPAEKQLFSELQAIGRWISDTARRHARDQ